MEKHTVLFVNDDLGLGNSIAINFGLESNDEWRVIVCTNERKLRKILKGGEKIDAALVDLRLEDNFRTDGLSIAKDLQVRGIPTSITTAVLLDWQKQLAQELGIPAFEINFLRDEKFSYWDALMKTIGREANVRRERGK